MCGRFAQFDPAERFAALADAKLHAEAKPRYNLAPTQKALVARETADGRELTALRWGLVPHWSKDLKAGTKMINARSETAASKPAFRDAFKSRRCLVAANGWYEWKVTPAGKVPMFIHRVTADGEIEPFYFAGLWASWRDKSVPDAEPLETFTILTRDAAPALAEVHDRMPVVLPQSVYSTSLDRDVTDNAAAAKTLSAAVLSGFNAYPVSTRVNSPKNDDDGCLAEVR